MLNLLAAGILVQESDLPALVDLQPSLIVFPKTAIP